MIIDVQPINCYERDVQKNNYNDDETTQSETKSPNIHDRNWWWMVYGKINKGLPLLRGPKVNEKSHDKEDAVEKLYEANRYQNDWKL